MMQSPSRNANQRLQLFNGRITRPRSTVDCPLKHSSSMPDVGADRRGRRRPDRKRRVSFSTTHETRLVASRFDLTQKETSSLWYSEEDKLVIEEGIIQDVRAMRSHQAPKTGKSSYRGLEHLSSATHARHVEEAQKRVIGSVLMTQEVQTQIGIVDVHAAAEEIAVISSRRSQAARDRAYMLGKCDEQAAAAAIGASTRRNKASSAARPRRASVKAATSA